MYAQKTEGRNQCLGKSFISPHILHHLCWARGTNDQTGLYNNSFQTNHKTGGHQFVVIK